MKFLFWQIDILWSCSLKIVHCIDCCNLTKDFLNNCFLSQDYIPAEMSYTSEKLNVRTRIIKGFYVPYYFKPFITPCSGWLKIFESNIRFATCQCWGGGNNRNFKKFHPVNDNSSNVGDSSDFLPFMLIQLSLLDLFFLRGWCH